MSSDNTAVTFTPTQLAKIESLGQTALQAIQNAPAGTCPPAVWAPLYQYILCVMDHEGLAGTTQAYWFTEARGINSDDTSNPVSFFVRDITMLGLHASSSSDPRIQQGSNAIGQNIYN